MRMVNKGFFKPLLPDFHSHLTIPVAFFSKYIQGTNEQHTTKLRSDASKITWEVKVEDGRRLTDGWKEFAIAHDLRIGDVLIFRQEKDMAFHVTLLGPSGCELQYESCSEEENDLGNIPKKKKSEREAAESSSLDPSCFLANIWPSSLRYDTLNLPKSFVRANGLETSCGGEIVLMNEKGSRSWNLVLKQKLSGTTYIRRGWRLFCSANRLKTGGVYTFKLIQRGRTPVLRLSSTESGSEERNIENIQRKKAEPSSLDPSCFVANISRATLRYDTLCLPMKFSRENGLDTRCGEIVLMNDKGGTWKLKLKLKRSCGTMYITQGWRSFCSANGLRAGSSFTFKLIQKEGTLALRLSPKETEEEEEDCSLEANEVESLSTEPESDEESSQDEKKVKKHRSTWKASPSQSQNRFVTLTLRPYNLKKYLMFLPLPFTRWHGINEETKMTLLDKNGVKWSTDLRSVKTNNDKIRLVGGWHEFFKANCVEIGETIMLKLIWEGDKKCVLKFCSKVKH